MAKRKKIDWCEKWLALLRTSFLKLRGKLNRWRKNDLRRLSDHVARCSNCEYEIAIKFGKLTKSKVKKRRRFIKIFTDAVLKYLSKADRDEVERLSRIQNERDKKIEQSIFEFLGNHPKLSPQNFSLSDLHPSAFFLAVDAVCKMVADVHRRSPEDEIGDSYILAYGGDILSVQEVEKDVFGRKTIISEDATIEGICLVMFRERFDNKGVMKTSRKLLSWVIAALRAEPKLLVGFSAAPVTLGVELIPDKVSVGTDSLEPWRRAPAQL